MRKNALFEVLLLSNCCQNFLEKFIDKEKITVNTGKEALSIVLRAFHISLPSGSTKPTRDFAPNARPMR
ncbi:MAG: hypothetical protein PUC06_00385, partial [Oscillospiraceae bacterium]|nr:hypothetical protein [Oscillospiraceae bacterium]